MDLTFDLGSTLTLRLMESRQTISAVAARTGFTPSALRFYESAGLITPDRTDSGYRVYDERSVERLRFIARAKQLGLRLDEITELVALWDDDQCAPVAARMHNLVAVKLAEAQGRIAEMVAFTADLQRFHASLAVGETTGSCSDHCACVPVPDASAAISLAAVVESTAEFPPIACTLAPAEMSQRAADWQSVLSHATDGPTRVDGGVTLRFGRDPHLAARVSALAASEQSCCSFFAFTVRIDHTGTELTVTAPADARPLVDALFGMPA